MVLIRYIELPTTILPDVLQVQDLLMFLGSSHFTERQESWLDSRRDKEVFLLSIVESGSEIYPASCLRDARDYIPENETAQV
jgi:hypothetical protein